MRTRHLCLASCSCSLLILTGAGCRDSGDHAGTSVVEAQQPPPNRRSPLPNRDGSFKFGVLGDFGTGSQAAVPARRADGQTPRAVQVRAGRAGRRQPVRLGAPAGLQEEVRDPLQAAAGCRREVLRVARQPRRARAALLQAVQHGREALLHVQPEPGRPLLRAREHLPGARADRSGSRRSSRPRAATGRSPSSTTRCTRQATGTARTSACAKCSSRSS